MSRYFGGRRSEPKGSQFRTLLFISPFLMAMAGTVAFGLLMTGQSVAKEQAEAPEFEVESRIQMVEVLVPIREIEPGTELDQSMFRLEARPSIGVPARAVHGYEEIKKQYARSLIVPEQPLVRSLVTNVRPNSTVTANIPPGFRAVTIRVDAKTSVEGFTRPGARVDVVWVHANRDSSAATTIVENAKVLSAGRKTAEAKEKTKETPIPSTVTLLVTTEDSNKIILASKFAGSLSLSLRGDRDNKAGGEGATTTVDNLLGRIKNEQKQSEGTLMIGGEKFDLVKGKLVPAEEEPDDFAYYSTTADLE